MSLFATESFVFILHELLQVTIVEEDSLKFWNAWGQEDTIVDVWWNVLRDHLIPLKILLTFVRVWNFIDLFNFFLLGASVVMDGRSRDYLRYLITTMKSSAWECTHPNASYVIQTTPRSEHSVQFISQSYLPTSWRGANAFILGIEKRLRLSTVSSYGVVVYFFLAFSLVSTLMFRIWSHASVGFVWIVCSILFWLKHARWFFFFHSLHASMPVLPPAEAKRGAELSPCATLVTPAMVKSWQWIRAMTRSWLLQTKKLWTPKQVHPTLSLQRRKAKVWQPLYLVVRYFEL